jgi:hypothetical protein
MCKHDYFRSISGAAENSQDHFIKVKHSRELYVYTIEDQGQQNKSPATPSSGAAGLVPQPSGCCSTAFRPQRYLTTTIFLV